MKPSVFDTHAHLSKHIQSLEFPSYPCLNVTTHAIEWQIALAIHHTHNNILPALGMHPWFLPEEPESDLTLLTDLLSSNKVFALGEIGLDYSHQYKFNAAKQRFVFESQLQLASQFSLPISIHSVKAHNDMQFLLKSFNLPNRGVLHGLGSSIEVIKGYIELGYKIGVNGISCRQNARRYHAMLQYFPLECFVLETDFPNVSLLERKQAYLRDIYAVAKQVAMLKKCPLEEVIATTSATAMALFYS